jgi:protein-tyrosine-phosphatase
MNEAGELSFYQSVPAAIENFQPGLTQRVLFLCSNNSALSQLAEAFLRRLDITGNSFEVYSAAGGPGVAKKLHPRALSLINDLGMDSEELYPKSLQTYQSQIFDYVIIVDDLTERRYQNGRLQLPATRRVLVWGFPDPTFLPDYLQSHSFQQIGENLFHLIRSLTRSPNFRNPAALRQMK